MDTTSTLDFHCDWVKGFPDAKEFPEFENSLFRMFSSDGHMTKGHFTFGDVESNSVVRIEFETMPVRGGSRYQIGEPFYFFDVKAELHVNGVFEQITLVDREESLSTYRPFLIF